MQVKARAVIMLDGRLVIADERRAGRRHLTLPGGRPARGETLEQTVVREVREEVGLSVTSAELLYVAEVVLGSTMQELNVIFRCVTDEPPVGSEPLTIGPHDADRAVVMPPILDTIFEDLADDRAPAPRFLGNVHASLGGQRT